ncbi:MAG: hypothetical protein KBD36_00030 [Alphaproteobacteria bacterium]|nr:hypothetical protein [Alphaproteobacteria bacterium]MBP9776225.1 hypothetical protein [Alphaproteobacteria bacterium]
MIVYNTSSYAPTITGMVVRVGFSQLGFSHQTSATAGNTAAIVASFSQKLILSQETVLDCMVDVAIGAAGSNLALKANSWIYELWGCNNSIMVCEKAHRPHSGKTH